MTPYPWAEGFWKVDLNGINSQPVLVNGSFVGVKLNTDATKIKVVRNSPRIPIARALFLAGILLLVCFVLYLVRAKWVLSLASLLLTIGVVVLCGKPWVMDYPAARNDRILLPNDYSKLIQKLPK